MGNGQSGVKGTPTILVIEDEADLCDILRDELSAAGYRVVVAGNGEQGLALLQEIEPDLILCDRAMPVMSGHQMLERIRGIYPQYRHVPFVFITALTEAEDRAGVRPLAPTAYLPKPLDFDVLHATIRRALRIPAIA